MSVKRNLIVASVALAVAGAGCGAGDESRVGAPDGGLGDSIVTTTTMGATTSPEDEPMKQPDPADPYFEEGEIVDTRDDLVSKPPSGDAQKSAAAPAPGSPVEQAMADLARRLDRPVGDISLVLAEDVTWRDGSMGCPEPGKFYTQALVPGLRIRLAAGGEIYEYHSGSNTVPFYCADPQEPIAGDA